MAKELDIAVLGISQLSRDCEKRPNKRPMLSDLRESGSLEQDADVVVFLYHESMYKKSAEKDVAELIIGKQRNGPTGKAEISWNRESMTFGNLSNMEEPESVGAYEEETSLF